MFCATCQQRELEKSRQSLSAPAFSSAPNGGGQLVDDFGNAFSDTSPNSIMWPSLFSGIQADTSGPMLYKVDWSSGSAYSGVVGASGGSLFLGQEIFSSLPETATVSFFVDNCGGLGYTPVHLRFGTNSPTYCVQPAAAAINANAEADIDAAFAQWSAWIPYITWLKVPFGQPCDVSVEVDAFPTPPALAEANNTTISFFSQLIGSASYNDPNHIYNIAIHEIGHVMGLDHEAADPNNGIMTVGDVPLVPWQFSDLTPNSYASLDCLYFEGNSTLPNAFTGSPTEFEICTYEFVRQDPICETETGQEQVAVSTELLRWYVDATAAPGSGNGTDLLPWHDFDEVDYGAIQASGDFRVDVAGGPSPAQRYTYNQPIVPTINNVMFVFADYSELVGGWGDTPLPGCADPITPTPTAQQAGIVNNVSGLQIIAQNTVGLQVRSWTSAGIDNRRTSSNGLFQNIEVFNNGIGDTENEWDFNSPQVDFCSNPSVQYPTYSGPNVAFPNLPGVWLAGPNHVFDGLIVHDNGQDAYQSRDEGTATTGGNNLANVTIRNGWMYNGRVYNGPAWPNGGPILPGQNVESSNYCSHTDGLQIFANADAGRNLQGTMSGVTIENTWIGPGLSNNLILGENNRVDVSNVTLDNVVLDRAADNQYIVNSGSTTNNVTWNNVTSYSGQQSKEHHFIAGNGSSGVTFNDSIASGEGIFGCADVNLFGSAAATANGSTADSDVTLGTGAGAWNTANVTLANTSGGAMGVYNDYATATPGGANDTTISAMIGATVSGGPDAFGSYSII